MPAFASKDGGASWEPVAPQFPGISIGQKAAALKLAGGALLLCSFDNKKQLVGGTFAALSFDDGKTWPHAGKIDGPTGYLSLAQGANGVIYPLGPNGSNIRCAAFNEAWLKEGQPPKPADSWLGQKVLARKTGASLTDTGKDVRPPRRRARPPEAGSREDQSDCHARASPGR